MVSSSTIDVADVLLQKGALTEAQVEMLRNHGSSRDRPIHRLILELNLATEQDTLRALAQVHSLEYRALDELQLSEELLRLIPLKLIFHYRFLPLEADNEVITVAYGDLPSSLELANLRLLLKREVHYVLTTPSRIDAVIKSQFGLGAETVEKLRESKGDLLEPDNLVFELEEGATADDGTISELVDQILAEALKLRATDLHFEPYAESIKLRYRIDGVLRSIPVPTELRPLYAAIVSRLKVMAELDISERRVPQDGRISMKTAGEAYDLRISIIPTKHGEALCLRILGRQSLFLGLDRLGMLPEQHTLFSKITGLAQGLILISGPTGSGKTTTLYGALNRAKDESRKIITIEDPIEYQIEGIAQIQTRDDIGLTFSEGLRSILRHDPDVVLVGEIRDQETAEIAVRAAQTGHLVFTTIHANDSLAAIPRLMDMGVDAASLSASLVCSIAQRLARRSCIRCLTDDPSPDPALLTEMAEQLSCSPTVLHPKRGQGCVECQDTGVRGQIALYEFAPITEPLAEAIHQRPSLKQLKQLSQADGWKPLRHWAFHRVQDQTIALPELQRITWRLDFAS